MRTKTIITIGPSSESKKMLTSLVQEGFDIARINFSHSSYPKFKSNVATIRALARRYKRDIKILQDLQGPRIRVGELPKEGREITPHAEVLFTIKKGGNHNAIFIDTPSLGKDIKKGDPLYLANGAIKLIVEKIKLPYIYTRAVRGAVLYSRKAVNVPHTKLRISGLTAKDIQDLKVGVRAKVDYVAISFVQSAQDIIRARKYVGRNTKIIAKIETALALKDVDAIIQAADGIMIARGDLGIEIPNERIPFIQKNLVRHATWHEKSTIIATQILTSMIKEKHPTRAEVSDIANAIFDGADAILLSDETASGDHPLQALEAANRVIRQTETYVHRGNYL